MLQIYCNNYIPQLFPLLLCVHLLVGGSQQHLSPFQTRGQNQNFEPNKHFKYLYKFIVKQTL